MSWCGFTRGPELLLRDAEEAVRAGERQKADRLLNHIVRMLLRESTRQQRVRKYMPELFILALRQGRCLLGFKVLLLMLLEPLSLPYLMQILFRFGSDVLHRR